MAKVVSGRAAQITKHSNLVQDLPPVMTSGGTPVVSGRHLQRLQAEAAEAYARARALVAAAKRSLSSDTPD
jgi:hypothetical protein